MTLRVAAELLARIEDIGVEARARHWAAMPEELAKRLRARTRRFADGIGTLMERSDAIRVNRVVGLGHREALAPRILDDIIEFYVAGRLSRFGVELGPGPQFEEIARWLGQRGFARRSGYSLLVRDLRAPVNHSAGEVKAMRASRAKVEIAVDLAQRIFAVPLSRRNWSLAAARQGPTQHFVAFVGEQPAAIGAVLVVDDIAWLGGGGTLTRFRHRGAHAALIAARLRYAQRMGCRWAWSETIVPQPGRPQGSRRNLMRLGFEEVFVKPSFVWTDRGRRQTR
jgi:hypothetical protein